MYDLPNSRNVHPLQSNLKTGFGLMAVRRSSDQYTLSIRVNYSSLSLSKFIPTHNTFDVR